LTTFNLQGIGMTSQRTRNRLVKRLEERGIRDERVLETIGSVPRHIFVDEALAHRAYEDNALPIGHGQTISQPYVVALMTQALLEIPETAPPGTRRATVLEIGTGSGYQAAVLATLVGRVYTVERIHALAGRARERFEAMRLRNVRMKHDDGNVGWREHAPFDAVLVTAAARTLPDTLLDQLADGGRLVAPVGDGDVQALKVFDREGDAFRQETVDYVRFVPLLRGTTR